QYDRAERSDSDIRKYSAPPKAFLAAAPENRVWGSATKGVRDTLASPNEQNQFPGLTILGLAIIGLVAGTALSKRLRAGLGLAVAGLCLGGVLVEGKGTMPNPPVPPAPPGVAAAAAPQLHLPTNAAFDRIYMLWSVDGFPKIANGTATFGIQSLDDLRTSMGS